MHCIVILVIVVVVGMVIIVVIECSILTVMEAIAILMSVERGVRAAFCRWIEMRQKSTCWCWVLALSSKMVMAMTKI